MAGIKLEANRVSNRMPIAVWVLSATVGSSPLAFASQLDISSRAQVQAVLTERQGDHEEQVSFKAELFVEPGKAGARRLVWRNVARRGPSTKAALFQGGNFEIGREGRVTVSEPPKWDAQAGASSANKKVEEAKDTSAKAKVDASTRAALSSLAAFHQRLRWYVVSLAGLAGRRVAPDETVSDVVRIPVGADDFVTVQLRYRRVLGRPCPKKQPASACVRMNIEATYDGRKVLAQGAAAGSSTKVVAAPSLGQYEVIAAGPGRRPQRLLGREQVEVKIQTDKEITDLPVNQAAVQMVFDWEP